MQTESTASFGPNDAEKTFRKRTHSLFDPRTDFNRINNNGAQTQKSNQKSLINQQKSKLGFAYMPSDMPIIIKDRTYMERKDTLNTFLKKKDFNFVFGIPENITMKSVTLSKHVSVEQVQNVAKVNKEKMIRLNNQKTGIMYTNELWSSKYYLQMIKKTGMRKNFDRLKLKDELQSAEFRYQQLDNLFKKKREKAVDEQEVSNLLNKFQKEPPQEEILQEEQSLKKKENNGKRQLKLFDVSEEPNLTAKLEQAVMPMTHKLPIHKKSSSNPLISSKFAQTAKGFNHPPILSSSKLLQPEITLTSTSIGFNQQKLMSHFRNSSMPSINTSAAQIANDQGKKLFSKSPKQLQSSGSPNSLHQDLNINLLANRAKSKLLLSPSASKTSEELKDKSPLKFNNNSKKKHEFFKLEKDVDTPHVTSTSRFMNSSQFESFPRYEHAEHNEFRKLIDHCWEANEENQHLLGEMVTHKKNRSKRRLNHLTEDAVRDMQYFFEQRKGTYLFSHKK